jgi:hypothetical protein
MTRQLLGSARALIAASALLLVVSLGAHAQSPASKDTSAHLAVEQSLTAILNRRAEIQRSVDGNDLEHLGEQLQQIREALRESNLQMDQAFLFGAWSHQSEKERAAPIIERMQEVQIVSLMGVATVAGYEYPTKKVPSAGKDSVRKLFTLLQSLITDVAALNRSLSG